VDFLYKGANGGILVNAHHAAKRAQRVERGTGEEGDSLACFRQGVVEGNQRHQDKEEDLDE